MSYRDDIPKEDGVDRFGGFYLVQPGSKHTTYNLKGDKGNTVFRIYPEIDMNGAELPYRVSAEPYDYSYWMRAEKMLRRCGVSDKFTAFTRVKGKDRDYQGPFERFVAAFNRLFNDVTNGKVVPNPMIAEWLKWRSDKKNLALSRIEMCGLLQGMVFKNGDKEYRGPDGRFKPMHPALLVITKTARTAFEELCNAEVEGYTGNPEDYSSRFACGDFLSCQNGKFVEFVYFPQNGQQFPHYKINVLNKVAPVPLATVKSEWKSWDKLLRFMTEEEQMQILCRAFPPESVDFVFGESDLADMLPGSVLGKYYGKPATASAQPRGRAERQQQAPVAAAPVQAESAPWDAGEPEVATVPSPVAPARKPAAPESDISVEADFDADWGEDLGGAVAPANTVSPAVASSASEFAKPANPAPSVASDPSARAQDARARLLAAQQKLEAARKSQ